MSFDNHKLKNYFDAAKAQKPPLELDDIKKQLSLLPHQSADSVPTHRLASVSSAYRAGLLFTLGILTIATSFIMSYNNGFVFLTRNNPSHKVNRPLPESTKRLYLKTDSDQQLSPELISPKSSNKHRYGQVDKTKIRGLALSSVDSLRPPVRFVELPMAALERLGFRIDSHGIHYQMASPI